MQEAGSADGEDARSAREILRRGEAVGVLFEPFKTEQFRADRFLRIWRENDRKLVSAYPAGRNADEDIAGDS